MAGTKGSGSSAAQRRAIASLLRIAGADLADARLVLQQGQGRNAAALGSRSLACLVHALAVSEQGWPAEDAAVRDIPRANPVQADLVAIDALLEDAADQRVQPDGRPEPPADPERVGETLDRLNDVLNTVLSAFDVAIDGEGASAHAAPIRRREEPPPRPPAPEDAADAAEAEPPEASPARPESVVSARAPRRRHGGLQHSDRNPGEADQTASRQPVIVGAGPRGETGTADRKATAEPDRSAGAGAARRRGAAPSAEAAQSGPLLASPAAPQDYTSTVFWALMDRWKLSDTEALDLIGHPGGLTRKGTRPRFRVAGKEAELFGHLREIDAALSPLVKDTARWMRQRIKEAPFKGATPLDLITRTGVEGSRAVERAVLMAALRKRAG